MSQWTKVDGSIHGVSADLVREETPQGSEGGSDLSRVGRDHWYWYASLRDRGEEDTPEIRDWFAGLCKRYSPTEATLEIDNGYSRYQFEWNSAKQVLQLDVPPLYKDEAHNVLKWIANRHDSLPPQYRDVLAPWVTLDV